MLRARPLLLLSLPLLLGGCDYLKTTSVFLLVIAAIFLIGIAGELVFARTGIPDVVWLIGVGILLGPVSGLVTKQSLGAAAPYFGALTLVVVLFNGGSELKLKELSQAAGRGSVLALSSFLLAVAVVTPVVMAAKWMGIVPSSWTWMHAVLVGTILGGSSSVVIMPALAKAGLSPRITNIVNLESALTDVLSVVSTGAVIQIMVPAEGQQAGASAAAITLLKSFGIGTALGVVSGLLAILVLRRLRKSTYAYPLTLGALLLLYVLVDELGGSAALGILAAAVMIGNAPELSKAIGLAKEARLGRNVKGVHGEMTFIIKSFFFTFIGAMLRPPWTLIFFGIFIGLALLVARIPSVVLSSVKSDISPPARRLMGVLFPRGMAAGVLAMMPFQAGVPETEELPVIVFAAVFTTILVFAGGFPVFKKRLPPSDLEAPDDDGAPPPADASVTVGFESPAEASAAASAVGVHLPAGPADATAIDPNGAAAEEAIPLVPSDD